jgi:hypothetical protein
MPPQDGYFFFRGEMLPFLPHTFAPLSLSRNSFHELRGERALVF